MVDKENNQEEIIEPKTKAGNWTQTFNTIVGVGLAAAAMYFAFPIVLGFGLTTLPTMVSMTPTMVPLAASLLVGATAAASTVGGIAVKRTLDFGLGNLFSGKDKKDKKVHRNWVTALFAGLAVTGAIAAHAWDKDPQPAQPQYEFCNPDSTNDVAEDEIIVTPPVVEDEIEDVVTPVTPIETVEEEVITPVTPIETVDVVEEEIITPITPDVVEEYVVVTPPAQTLCDEGNICFNIDNADTVTITETIDETETLDVTNTVTHVETTTETLDVSETVEDTVTVEIVEDVTAVEDVTMDETIQPVFAECTLNNVAGDYNFTCDNIQGETIQPGQIVRVTDQYNSQFDFMCNDREAFIGDFLDNSVYPGAIRSTRQVENILSSQGRLPVNGTLNPVQPAQPVQPVQPVQPKAPFGYQR